MGDCKTPGAAKEREWSGAKEREWSGVKEREWSGAKEREWSGDTESGVAGTLLNIVRQAPDGQISAAQLCSALYQKCASAKVIIHDYGGLKHFVASPVLKEAVEFQADEVLLSTMCLCAWSAIVLRILCVD